MYRVDRNNFYSHEKQATIYTPLKTSEFLFSLISPFIDKARPVIDPCVGLGSLLIPFMNSGYEVIGIDIERGFEGRFIHANYLDIKPGKLPHPSLIIMNPPFNIDQKTKEYIKRNYSGRPLLPEIWLTKAIELFGKNIPIVMFTPYGFRLNLTENSKRWLKFTSGVYPDITSIVSLPKNLFKNILFHSEVVIFNLPQLKGHYFHGYST